MWISKLVKDHNKLISTSVYYTEDVKRIPIGVRYHGSTSLWHRAHATKELAINYVARQQ